MNAFSVLEDVGGKQRVPAAPGRRSHLSAKCTVANTEHHRGGVVVLAESQIDVTIGVEVCHGHVAEAA